MAAAATTVQVTATWPRCRELQWHLCSHHQTLGQGRAWPTVPRVPPGVLRPALLAAKSGWPSRAAPRCSPLAISCAAQPLTVPVPALSRERVLPPCSQHRDPWGREKTGFLSPWRIEQCKDNIICNHQHYLCPVEPSLPPLPGLEGPCTDPAQGWWLGCCVQGSHGCWDAAHCLPPPSMRHTCSSGCHTIRVSFPLYLKEKPSCLLVPLFHESLLSLPHCVCLPSAGSA